MDAQTLKWSATKVFGIATPAAAIADPLPYTVTARARLHLDVFLAATRQTTPADTSVSLTVDVRNSGGTVLQSWNVYSHPTVTDALIDRSFLTDPLNPGSYTINFSGVCSGTGTACSSTAWDQSSSDDKRVIVLAIAAP